MSGDAEEIPVDVCVVGAGVMGLSAAWACVRRGLDVVVLEQFGIGNARGSSHGPARAFAAQHTDPSLVSKALQAHSLWKELEAASGTGLLWGNGAMLRADSYESVLRELDAQNVRAELMSPDALRRNYGISLPGDLPVVATELGGTIDAAATLQALEQLVRGQSGEIREHTRVKGIARQNGQLAIRTSGGVVNASTVVLTPGPWTGRLGETVGISLETFPSRQTVGYFGHPEAGSIPALYEDGDPPMYWVSSPGNEIRVGAHIDRAPDSDPDNHREPDENIIRELHEHMSSRFPSHEMSLSRAETCFYTGTQDGEFHFSCKDSIIGCAVGNGRGFKFAPLIGEILVDMAERALVGDDPSDGDVW